MTQSIVPSTFAEKMSHSSSFQRLYKRGRISPHVFLQTNYSRRIQPQADSLTISGKQNQKAKDWAKLGFFGFIGTVGYALICGAARKPQAAKKALEVTKKTGFWQGLKNSLDDILYGVKK